MLYKGRRLPRGGEGDEPRTPKNADLQPGLGHHEERQHPEKQLEGGGGWWRWGPPGSSCRCWTRRLLSRSSSRRRRAKIVRNFVHNKTSIRRLQTVRIARRDWRCEDARVLCEAAAAPRRAKRRFIVLPRNTGTLNGGLLFCSRATWTTAPETTTSPRRPPLLQARSTHQPRQHIAQIPHRHEKPCREHTQMRLEMHPIG